MPALEYRTSTGDRYDADNPYDIVAIAKTVRSELAAERKAGDRHSFWTLAPDAKVSIRTNRYAGGRSIDATITLDPYHRHDGVWAPYVEALRWDLESRLDAFRRTRDSNQPDDYYATNFYRHVTVTERVAADATVGGS